jgi:hypothetical protein
METIKLKMLNTKIWQKCWTTRIDKNITHVHPVILQTKPLFTLMQFSGIKTVFASSQVSNYSALTRAVMMEACAKLTLVVNFLWCQPNLFFHFSRNLCFMGDLPTHLSMFKVDC